MRLGDLDALKEDFKARLEKAKNWKENALNNSDDELVIRATATIDFICEVIMTINNAPTVELFCAYLSDGEVRQPCFEAPCKHERPQDRWVSVSERLPERYKEVIVTDIETEETYCSWYHGNGYWECDNGVLKNRIIAWQPLPKPYKKGGAE